MFPKGTEKKYGEDFIESLCALKQREIILVESMERRKRQQTRLEWRSQLPRS